MNATNSSFAQSINTARRKKQKQVKINMKPLDKG